MSLNYQTLSLNNYNLFYYKNVPNDAKAIILIIHGFRGHSGQYEELVKYLNMNNYGVYGFDQRGHGRSAELPGYVDNFEDFIVDIKHMIALMKANETSLPIFTVGHSMGGLTSFIYGALYPETINGQVFSAAALTLPFGVRFIPKIFFRLLKKFPKFKIYPVIKRKSSRNKEFSKHLKNDPYAIKYATTGLLYEFLFKGIGMMKNYKDKYKVPCLLIHGNKDKIIPFQSSTNIYGALSIDNKTLIIYDGLYHELLQEPERRKIFRDLTKWLDDNGPNQ